MAGSPRRQLRIVQGGEPPGSCRAPARSPDDLAALFDDPGLEAIFERGLGAIMALTGARGAAVRRISPDGRTMQLVGSVGLAPAVVEAEREVPVDCGICGAALRADRSHREDVSAFCVRRLGEPAAPSGDGPAVAVPLHCDGRVIGVFNLFFEAGSLPQPLEAVAEPTARLLELLLDHASLARQRLQASIVAERQMLAGEVHDSLAQGLAYMRMRMPLLHDAIRGAEPDHALKYFEDVNDAMGEAHGRLRELITQFRHAVDQGLLPALESTARTFEDRTGVKLSIENRAGRLRLPPEHEAQVYQIVQEALANVVKHAGASEARIVIESTRRCAKVTVEDDGRGVPRSLRTRQDGEHYGMEIMRERAERIGATLEIRSSPRRGTRVRVTVPVGKPAVEAP